MNESKALFNWIDKQQPSLVETLQHWAHINSGSTNLAGLAKMHDALWDELGKLNAEIESIQLSPYTNISDQGKEQQVHLGNAIRVRKRPQAPKQILLCGHMDTVFAADHPFQSCQFTNANTLNGPGVADMKGGLLVMLTALRAFEQSELTRHLGWEILIVPDEELGSPGSAELLQASANRHHIGLVFEPAIADGTFAGARKGSGNFTLITHGKNAHAGRDFHAGRNAIAALASGMQLIHQLNGQREQVTINLGRISGGGPSNIVPDLAACHFNIRTQQHSDEAWCLQELQAILATLNKQDGIHAELHGKFNRPPKQLSPAIKELFDLLKNCGDQLGIPISYKATGGCCDGNNLAAAGLPNIDTLGVRGGNIHSSEEFMLLDSLPERIKLCTLLLLTLAENNSAWQSITQHRT